MSLHCGESLVNVVVHIFCSGQGFTPCSPSAMNLDSNHARSKKELSQDVICDLMLNYLGIVVFKCCNQPAHRQNKL